MALGLVLDEGATELVRALAGLALVVFLALVLVVVTPLSLLGAIAPSPQLQPPTTAPDPKLVPPSPAGLPDSRVVALARGYLGVPYVFGGTNPSTGLDCSGLVQLVYRQAGVALPRTAQQQYDATTRIPRAQLQPGDLVFFARTYPDPHDWITHVGIYVGDGQQINAPTEGQVVSIQPVFVGFWGAHYAGAGRPAFPTPREVDT